MKEEKLFPVDNSSKTLQDIVHVEIRQSSNSLLSKEEIISRAKSIISARFDDYDYSRPIITKSDLIEEAENEIESIEISMPHALHVPTLNSNKIIYHVYTFASDEPENLDLGIDDLDIGAATHWCVPTSEFDGLWDSLIFEKDIKSKLLRYINTTLIFSKQGVNSTILPWNKVIFLHGPPGTGKTSLCKALAQKISIRFNMKYQRGYFVEIHSHNLFSKWFSESGKFVTKLFESITTMVEDENAFVILLIDEVETLAHCRKASIQGQNEPSDGIRVVNALLTHLDKIKRHPNVLIMTTSNITEAVDMALVDRADIKQFIGLPCSNAIFSIYKSCIQELQKTGIIAQDSYENCLLQKISEDSVGLSGRTIRKLPLITHALHFETIGVPPDEFLKALASTVKEQFEDQSYIIQK